MQTLEQYFGEYNITYDNMIPYFESRLKRFKTKVGKVIMKMQEDYNAMFNHFEVNNVLK